MTNTAHDTKVLKAEELTKSYKGRKVVDDISIEIKSGEVVGLLGPNGAGKTTSFYLILGLVAPDKGKVLLNNRDNTHIIVSGDSAAPYLPNLRTSFSTSNFKVP